MRKVNYKKLTTKKVNSANSYYENFIFDEMNNICYSNSNEVVRIGNFCYELDFNGEFVKKIECESLISYKKHDVITIDGKMCVIDKKGNLVIPPEYDNIVYYVDDLWKVSYGNKEGLISTNRVVLLEIEYDSITPFTNNYSEFIVSLDGKYGIVDMYGEIIIPLEYEKLEVANISKKFLIATKNGKSGIITGDDKVLVPFCYANISVLGEDSFVVTKINGLKNIDNEVIIINSKNEQICNTIFSDISNVCLNSPLVNRLYPACIKGIYGFVDEFGNKKIDFRYKSVGVFKNGFCRVETESEQFLINELGEVVISDFDYDDLLYVIDDNHIVVTKKGLGSGIISKNNHKITEMMFEFKPSELFSKEFFRASYKGKVGFINKDGNPLIIDKKGLNIPETKLDFDFLSVVDELRWLLP